MAYIEPEPIPIEPEPHKNDVEVSPGLVRRRDGRVWNDGQLAQYLDVPKRLIGGVWMRALDVVYSGERNTAVVNGNRVPINNATGAPIGHEDLLEQDEVIFGESEIIR